MITPVIQEASEAPQPIIPPPNPERNSRNPLLIALIVVGVILLPVILLGAGLFALRAGGDDVVEQFEPADEVVEPAAMDMEMQTEIVLESGPTITLPESVFPGEDRDVVDGSVQLVSRVTSLVGTTDLYRYETVLLDSGTGQTMDCLGLSQGGGATVSCRDSGEAEPLNFWGTADGPSGTWYSVAVAGLPLEATRLVTETVNGRSIGSDIVNGVAFQEWPGADGAEQFGQAARTIALDDQGVVVWSASGGN